MAKVTPIEFRPSKLVVHLEPADPTQEYKYSAFVKMSYNETIQVCMVNKAHSEFIWKKNLYVWKEITKSVPFGFSRHISEIHGIWKEFDEKVYTWILTTIATPQYLYHISVITDGTQQKVIIHNNTTSLWKSTNLVLAVTSHTKQIYTDEGALCDTQLYIMYVPEGLYTLASKPVHLIPVTWDAPWEINIEADEKKHPLAAQLPKVEKAVVKASHPLLVVKFSHEEEKDDSHYRL